MDTLITASPEFFKGKSVKEVSEFFQRAVVHMDERTPHLHLTFVPLTKDNRLCAKEILGKRVDLSKWQDDFHAHIVERARPKDRPQAHSHKAF